MRRLAGLFVALTLVSARLSAEGRDKPAPGHAPPSGAITNPLGSTPFDPILDGRGLSPVRENGFLLPFEHIDPFTGNLLLTFTDAVLPGNAGFDLAIMRSYNSKIYLDYGLGYLYEESWAGIGWTLHLGRVIDPSAGGRPVIEMPDGSQHVAYFVTSPGNWHNMITRDFWRYDAAASPPVLSLTNGRRYFFGHVGNTLVDGRTIRYVTHIDDPFGNTVDVSYWSDTTAGAPRDAIQQVTQNLGGGQVRTASFTYGTDGGLSSMTSDGHTWQYEETSVGNGWTLLTKVTPPAGPPWKFQYQTNAPQGQLNWELTQVKTPQGGVIDYAIDFHNYRYCSVNPFSPNPYIATRGVTSRSVSGRDLAPATWSYGYAQGAQNNQTIVFTPCGSTTYTFYGIGGVTRDGIEGQCPDLQGGQPFLAAHKIGAQESKVTKYVNDVLETETTDWRAGLVISPDPEVIGPYVKYYISSPLVASRTIERGDRTYQTNLTYSESYYNDFGRPYQVDETGPTGETRRTSRTFAYDFGPLFGDRVASETVREPATAPDSQSFTSSYAYDHDTGFKTAQTIHGIPTTFTASTDGRGNLGQATDATGRWKKYTYSWGQMSSVKTPDYPAGANDPAYVQRAINGDGTVAWEARRGFATSFEYDGLFRQTKATPPAGNFTTTSYDAPPQRDFESITVTRGSSSRVTTIDGFSRPRITTESASGVKTERRYDTCGRVAFQSYPYTADVKGDDFDHDFLGRLTHVKHADDTEAFYSYSDFPSDPDVTFTNERAKRTELSFLSFGDPSETRLVKLKDANASRTWNYGYNALGALTSAASPISSNSWQRSWVYYGTGDADGAPGLLKTETHPEQGTTTYKYYANGTLKSRKDANTVESTYTYDNENRLSGIDLPGSEDDVSVQHDGADNRSLVSNGHVSSTFTFDGANRLTSRTDMVDGVGFTTGFTPDANDNVRMITYPSGLKVYYDYDGANRVSCVYTGPDSPVPNCGSGRRYASGFSYHPSGGPTAFTLGNGLVQTFGYDDDRYWPTRVTVSGGFLDLQYQSYDGVGNVQAITDNVQPQLSTNLFYDDVDRLTGAQWVTDSVSYGYDTQGNITSKTRASAGQNIYSYSSSRLDHITGPEAEPQFLYDANGNLTSHAGGQRTYTYTPENQVRTATVGGVTTTYRYDGEHLRASKNTAGASTYFVHGVANQLLAEYRDACAGQRELVRNYVYAGSRLIASEGPAISVAFSSAGQTVYENLAAGKVQVNIVLTASSPLACALTVRYLTADGTAHATEDYLARSGTVQFPQGATTGTRTIEVPIVNDIRDEEDLEDFTIMLPDVPGVAGVHRVTVRDDDPPPLLSISNYQQNEGTGGVTPFPFHLALSTPSGRTITLRATTSDQTATSPGDYTARSNVLLTIPPDTPGLDFLVDVNGDPIDEPNQTFLVTLSAPVNAILQATQAVVTILDDDDPPQMTIADVRVSDRNAGTVAYFPVTLSLWSEFPISVIYGTVGGTAQPGADYFGTAGTLIFQPGQVGGPVGDTRQTVAVPIAQDNADEGTEQFTVQLNTAVNALLVDGSAQGTIYERYSAPACASRLDPPGALDLVVSEIAPGQHIELYNPGPFPFLLGASPHALHSRPNTVTVTALAPNVIVPSHGYARLPWPATPPNAFTDTAAGGEIVLYRNATLDPQNILAFVCWGTVPHPSRKADAEGVGKWAGNCAPALGAGALHRLRGSDGRNAAAYDTTSPPTPMTCAGVFQVTTKEDTNDGKCDADCSLREAVLEANLAPGPDTIRLSKGVYTLTNCGNGEDAGASGDLDITDEVWISGAGAVSTVVDAGCGVPEATDRGFDVQAAGALTLTGVTVQHGVPLAFHDQDGGGIRNRGRLTLRDVALKNNAANGGGGGLSSYSSSLELRGVTVSGNQASQGGGLNVQCNACGACVPCTAVLTNTTISGNQATGSGGGLWTNGVANVQLRNTTITANISDSDGNASGLGGGVAASSGVVVFRNSILAGNTDLTGLAPNCSVTTAVSENYNLLGTMTGCSFPQSTGDTVEANALLGPLADNRGPTMTHAPAANSPAVDTGYVGHGQGFPCEPTDQRWQVRPQAGVQGHAAVCDKGSFELCSVAFSDTAGRPAEAAVKELACRGIVAGCGDGVFCPTDPVTRAQIAVILVAAMGEAPSGARFDRYFTDLNNDALAGYVNRLYELGVANGCAAARYCPGDPVTREQMAVLLVAALEEKPSDSPTNFFSDISTSFARRYINRLWELNITSGCGGGRFCPGDPLTREAAAAWVAASFFAY